MRQLMSIGAALMGALAMEPVSDIPQPNGKRLERARKREERHAAFYAAGLNGQRAVARRLRQMAKRDTR